MYIFNMCIDIWCIFFMLKFWEIFFRESLDGFYYEQIIHEIRKWFFYLESYKELFQNFETSPRILIFPEPCESFLLNRYLKFPGIPWTILHESLKGLTFFNSFKLCFDLFMNSAPYFETNPHKFLWSLASWFWWFVLRIQKFPHCSSIQNMSYWFLLVLSVF